MKQIIWNWLMVFIIPAVTGAALRGVLSRIRRGYGVTLGLAVLAAVSWSLFYMAPGFRTEAHGIVTAQITCCAAGALLVEITAIFWKRR